MEIIKIISDSSPIISFSSIGEILLLNKLFPKGIIIPRAVLDEVVAGELGKEAFVKAVKDKWIKITPVINKDIYKYLIKKGLDHGESEAITLAYEKGLPVLLDEAEARNEAKLISIPFTGTIGCLLKAKQNHVISKVKPYIDSMIKTCSFRISHELYYKILKSAGE